MSRTTVCCRNCGSTNCVSSVYRIKNNKPELGVTQKDQVITSTFEQNLCLNCGFVSLKDDW
jgi:hypothetical protein